jgi:hypothetical protein
MTVEQFNKNMSIFKRFLKEEGRYKYMMHYLFGYGRGLDEFYDMMDRLEEMGYSFGDILHLTFTLGPADIIIDWEKNIEKLSDKFRKYYRERAKK